MAIEGAQNPTQAFSETEVRVKKTTAINENPTLEQAGSSRSSGLSGVEKTYTPEEVKKLSEVMDGFLKSISPELNVSIDKELSLVIFKFTNTETDEVIMQVPSEEFVELMSRMQKASDTMGEELKGILVEKES